MQLEPTYSNGAINDSNNIGGNALDAMCRARTIMRQGREAARNLAKLGMIRPKTQEEIKQDLAAFKEPERKGVGRPKGDLPEFLEEETLEAFERYESREESIHDIASDYGTTENSLRQRFRRRNLKRGKKL